MAPLIYVKIRKNIKFLFLKRFNIYGEAL